MQGETLELLVPETAFHRRLAIDWQLAALDPRGERVAYAYPSGEGFRLYAGAVPR